MKKSLVYIYIYTLELVLDSETPYLRCAKWQVVYSPALLLPPRSNSSELCRALCSRWCSLRTCWNSPGVVPAVSQFGRLSVLPSIPSPELENHDSRQWVPPARAASLSSCMIGDEVWVTDRPSSATQHPNPWIMNEWMPYFSLFIH